MSPETIGLIGVVCFLILLALKVPVAISMLSVGLVGFTIMKGLSAALSMAVSDVYATFSSYSLSVIPMFVWMGFIAYYSGVGERLYKFAYRFIGHWPGGLAIATQAACGLFGAICGSNTATAATISAIAIPEMRKYKYDDSLSTASVAAGGALGILIPPSVIFIVYGIATEQSIQKLFISGIIPGILLMLLFMAAIFIVVKRNPKLAPAGPRFTWKERFTTLNNGLLEVFLTFIVSLGGMFLGWFTPTQAGAVGAAAILVITVIRRLISWEGFKKSLSDTVRTTSMIMFLVAGAVVFGRFIAISRLPFALANWATELNLPRFAIMGIIILIFLILGCFIDALAMILLTIPIFYPVAVDVLGYDPIWFGVVIVLVVAMGVITPPVGMNVFVVKGVIKDVSAENIFKGIWPFLIAIIVCLALLIMFPQLVTFLPGLL
ncbi:MAG: TRAP transporter large permease [Eubacteriales bacterium]|nr:TRAP transporter large permease [Eubacteriales bacterium]